MEDRVAKLEEFVVETRDRLVKIETRLDQTATKADLAEAVGGLRSGMHKAFADMVRWMVGTAVVLGASGITWITFVLNHASPKEQPAQLAPIVIQLPNLPPVQAPSPRP